MADEADQLAGTMATLNFVEAAFAAGATPSAESMLLLSCELGGRPFIEALLAAGANPNVAGEGGATPLHKICKEGDACAVRALLAAGADPAAVDSQRDSPLMLALDLHRAAAAEALLEAAPEVALLRDRDGQLPLKRALQYGGVDGARCLLQHGALPSAGEVLSLLETDWGEPHRLRGSAPSHERRFDELMGNPYWHEMGAEDVQPLYATLAARQPLTPAEWAHVPNPCAGLGATLPAVLARSEAEAALLVAHLPAADRERLRTAALCLRRTERVHGLELPPAVVRPLLLAAVE